MSRKKFKRQRKRSTKRLFIPINLPEPRPIKYKTISNDFSLTDIDRISYSFQVDEQNNVVEIINVSQEIYLNNRWATVIRYDSEHGFLHRHSRLTLRDLNGTTSVMGVKKTGNPKDWLTWAINDIKNKYKEYKHGFIKRNQLSII